MASTNNDYALHYFPLLFQNKIIIQLGEVEVKEHDVITIDGGTGKVCLGTVDRRSAVEDEDFQTVLKWADDLRGLRVRGREKKEEALVSF